MDAQHRILVFGASNLWLSRRTLLLELRKRFLGRLELGLAFGPGRSYGLHAGNPFFRYQPLKDVSFGFEREPLEQKIAFITDIGNDIAYRQNPDTIISWVSALSERLERYGYYVIVGGTPAESLGTLHPRIFNFLLKLYYSEESLTQEQAVAELFELEARIQDLCQDRSYEYCKLDSEWFTYDHFHLKPKGKKPYWESLLANFPLLHEGDVSSMSLLRPLSPDRYWFLGRQMSGGASYPALLSDSSISIR